MSAFAYLTSLDLASLVLLFWYTVVLDLPRYTLGALAIAVAGPGRGPLGALPEDLTVSVLLVGHNEARALPACIASLGEQTIARRRGRKGMEIIVVDDGSTDRMWEVARALRDAGRIDGLFRLHQRGGKSAGVNLALDAAKGEIVVIADIDTTFDRDALENMVRYFSDPRVGAVGGNLGVRNAEASLVTRFQAIEYAIGISLGRRIMDAFGTLPIVSGAFGAFRRSALEAVGRQDVEIGEDADLTMKLRRAGYEIRFAPEAWALTDVPATLSALTAQRLRWDRGLVTIWARKFRDAFDPRNESFRLKEALSVADILFFQLALAFVLPAYLVWLFYYFGGFAAIVLAATLVVYFMLDILAFLTAVAVGADRPWRLFLYLPLYTVMQISVMRMIRLIAIVQELIFRRSYRDSYVPERIMKVVERV